MSFFWSHWLYCFPFPWLMSLFVALVGGNGGGRQWRWEATEDTLLPWVSLVLSWPRSAYCYSAELQHAGVASHLSSFSWRPPGQMTFCTAHAKTVLHSDTANPTIKKLLTTFLIQMATVNSWYVTRETKVWKQTKSDNPLLD